jgi:hypothetical protein
MVGIKRALRLVLGEFSLKLREANDPRHSPAQLNGKPFVGNKILVSTLGVRRDPVRERVSVSPLLYYGQ